MMAVIDAMGLLGERSPVRARKRHGHGFTGRLAGRTAVGDYPAIITEIEGGLDHRRARVRSTAIR